MDPHWPRSRRRRRWASGGTAAAIFIAVGAVLAASQSGGGSPKLTLAVIAPPGGSAGQVKSSYVAALQSPVTLESAVSLDGFDSLAPFPATALSANQSTASLAAQVTGTPDFTAALSSASSVTTEFALFTHKGAIPVFDATPAYVVVLHNVPLDAFEHGGSDAMESEPTTVSASNVQYTYYIVVNSQTAQLLASFDEVSSS
jgi:hypothetical protein